MVVVNPDTSSHNQQPARVRARGPLRRGRTLSLVALWCARAATIVVVLALIAVTLPGLAGYHNVTVTGGSMGSALPSGSVAVTRTIDFRDVHVGDVVAFQHSGSATTVVHRVVAINETDDGRVAVTRGDANGADDADGLSLQNGRGDRVAYYVPWIGYVLVFAQSPAGIVVMIAAAVTALLMRTGKRSSGTEVHASPSNVA